MRPYWYQSLSDDGRAAFWGSYAGFTLVAMSVQLYGFIVPTLIARWALTSTEAGMLASATLLSGALGGWLAGSLSDILGRIRLLGIAIVWLSVSTVLCGLAQSFDQLVAARFAQGIGFGAEWAVGAVFMSEFAPASTRGRILGALQSAWAAGWALAAISTSVALALLPADLDWRFAFFIGLVPALALCWIRSRMADSPVMAGSIGRQRWHAIFSSTYLGRTVKGGLLATGTHGGYWAIATWWPTMLIVERGQSATNASLHMSALIGGAFIGYFLGAWLSDSIGRRMTLSCFALGGASVALVATQFPVSDAALLLLTPALGLFVLGIYSAVGPVLTELYPAALRGSGLGFCYNVGRGLAGITPVAIGSAVASVGYAQAIGLYVAASYVIVLAAAAMLRETRGIEFAVSEA